MSSDVIERKLAAILSADVVGYSRLMAEDEDATVRTLAAYREEVGLLVRQQRGRLVDFTGDNFLAEFATATTALTCALEIQGVLYARNARLPAERRMQFRIGVHLGEARAEGERLYGDAVNVAARLQALAEPGGVCISDDVLHQVQRKLELEFEDLGAQAVKNIPDPVHVYRVREVAASPVEVVPAAIERPANALRGRGRTVALAALGAAALAALGWWASQRQSVSTGPIRAIAVLPLENLSGDPEQEYFADGMTEELIGELAKIGALRVISRTSVMRYKQTDKSIPEIAAELGVEGAIEGTVTREQDRVRVTVQLIDARTGTHLWANRFERELSSVLALQSDVARAVAEQLRVELDPGEQAAAAPARSVDPQAFEFYLRGLEARGSGGDAFAAMPAAIAQFERAVEIDPGFAEAWAALGAARQWLSVNPFDTRARALAPKAREAAQRALELDDRLGAAHSVSGDILLHHAWDFEAARPGIERGVELSPSDPIALNGYGYYLLLVGRTEEALAVMERLRRVAPFDRFYRGSRVRNFTWARQYERALEELERVREADPSFVEIAEVTIYVRLGRLEGAHRAHVAFYERCGPPCDWMREAIERGWSEGGLNASFRALAEAAGKKAEYSPLLVANWYSAIDDKYAAFAWLERGYRARDPLMVGLKTFPAFEPLRSDPRFQDLLRRIGFPET